MGVLYPGQPVTSGLGIDALDSFSADNKRMALLCQRGRIEVFICEGGHVMQPLVLDMAHHNYGRRAQPQFALHTQDCPLLS